MSVFLHSIRWRVQVWHGVILFLVIAAFCFTAYRLAWGNQMTRVDRNLGRTERNLIRTLMNDFPESAATERRGPPSPERIAAAIRSFQGELPAQLVSTFSGTDPGFVYFSLRDSDGKVLLQSPNFPSDITTIPELNNGDDMRTVAGRREVIRRNPEGLVSLFGVDMTPENEELHRFIISLIAVGLSVWAIGLVGGWWLSGRAILPIRTISATATRIADGNLSERISTDGTESELDQLSHVLNTTFERLHAAFERQKQFTADASHELRTPVTILLSETQRILKRERSNEEYRAALETCRSTSERMRRLIEALLQLAHQESTGDTAPREICDLADIARDCVQQLEPLAAQHQLRITTELQPAVCRGNPTALATLITNLITNALQHHDHPQGNIRVMTKRDKNNAVLAVCDDGPGIPPEDLPHLFERFYRVDKARTSGSGHIGLGLAIARTIIENHQGTITGTNNTTERGATFTCRLPAA